MRRIKFHADSNDVFFQREHKTKIEAEHAFLRSELTNRLRKKIQTLENEATTLRFSGRINTAAMRLQSAARLRALIR